MTPVLNVLQSSCSKSLSNRSSQCPVISESSVPVWGCICLDLMWFVLLFEFRFQTSHTALRQMRFFSPAEPQPSDKLTSNQSPTQCSCSDTHVQTDPCVCVCVCKCSFKASLRLIKSILSLAGKIHSGLRGN